MPPYTITAAGESERVRAGEGKRVRNREGSEGKGVKAGHTHRSRSKRRPY